MPANKWSDDPFFNALVSLRAHVKDCYKCKYMLADVEAAPACAEGIRRTALVMKSMDALLKAKLAAIHSAEQIFYPCPDVTKHGDGYALVARPMKAIGTQDGLF